MDRAAVGNAADKEQVRQAKRSERSRRDQELNDLRWVLETAHGRRFLWRLLHYFIAPEGVSNMFQTGALLPWRAGMYDAGMYLKSEIQDADPDGYFRMMQEDRATRTTEDLVQKTPERKPREEEKDDED